VATNALWNAKVSARCFRQTGLCRRNADRQPGASRLFDLHITPPTLLYARAVEAAGGCGRRQRNEPPDEAVARAPATGARGRDGACAIALICLKYPDWAASGGNRAGRLAARQPAVSPLLRLVPRGDTSVVDAYLSPILRRYVEQVSSELGGVRLYFMQSNGGLTDASQFQGKDAILSGPAGGIVGAARTAGMAGLDQIIGFDMGGTSTDVALYAGQFERTFETEVAGVRMRAPMMAINTVRGRRVRAAFRRIALSRRPRSARRESRPRAADRTRRPADRHRRQCVRRQGPAGSLPGDIWIEWRSAARCRYRAQTFRRYG
jgi:N-methylhydantoinase A/oxoprolinase/acetone carboxylase beta subunit